MWRAVGEDASARVTKLVGNCDQLRILNDLEWKRHVNRAGNAGHITGRLRRIAGLSTLKVFLFLREGRGLIWNFAALDHTLSRGRTQRRIVILEIPRSSVQYLPNAVEVGLAVGCARNCSRRRLSPGRQRQEENA